MYNIRDTNISNILSNNYKSMYKGNTDTIIFNDGIKNPFPKYNRDNIMKIRNTVYPLDIIKNYIDRG